MFKNLFSDESTFGKLVGSRKWLGATAVITLIATGQIPQSAILSVTIITVAVIVGESLADCFGYKKEEKKSEAPK